jgi:hypothetical protein
MHRRAATALLVAMVALAGCSLPGGDLGMGDDPNEAGTDDGSTPTATPEFEYPAGFSEDGVDDVEVALEGHTVALANSSGFALAYSAAVDSEERSSVLTYDERVEPRAEEALVRVNVTSGNVSGHYEQYYTADSIYVKAKRPGSENVTYSNESRPYDVSQFVGAEGFIRPVLENVTFESSRVVTRDGDRVVEYDDGRLREAGRLPTGDIESGDVTEFSAAMEVHPDGTIRAIQYEATVEEDGRERHLSISIQVTDVGATTVDAPEWTDRA